MAINRGKKFEEQVRAAFERVPDTSVIRLIDPQSGYAGVRNICDFIIYHYPVQYFVECKSCYGNTLPFSNITDNQWTGLLEQSNIAGVVAGYMIWFIDHDITIFVSADIMEKHKQLGEKSFNITKPWVGEYEVISGKKRKILFDYDVADFMRVEG